MYTNGVKNKNYRFKLIFKSLHFHNCAFVCHRKLMNHLQYLFHRLRKEMMTQIYELNNFKRF